MKFLRNLLAAIIGCLIAFGIMFVMFLVFVSLAGSAFGDADKQVVVDENSVLKFQLSDPVKDYTQNNEADLFSSFGDQYVGLNKIITAIEAAKEDSKIRGISIHNNVLSAGMSQTKAIRDALKDFKSSGKFIYAYGDVYNQSDYYLASVADSIFINPVGELDFKGLASEVLFYKDLQEKSGVKLEVIRHGKYKSAVEPFLSNEMSDANREQISELLFSLWDVVLEGISESRNLSQDQLNTIADNLAARTPKMAVASQLVDKISFFDEYESALKNAIDSDDLSFVDFEDYMEAAKGKSKAKDKIAVIYAQGDIVYGEGDSETIGQGIMMEAIRKAKKDDAIKAVVLRVNSPGGSALASDIIWREIENLKEEKPVIVSMGDVAASGGYYISAGADYIFSEPNTITGSIGVFGVLPNMYELSNNIGINSEQVGTNKQSVGYTVFEPLNDDFKELVQEGIEEVYDIFLERVAEGRGMQVSEVDKVAQGRVWSGVEAKEKGLVDALGGLNEAIAYAAEESGLEDYKIKNYPIYKSDFEKLMEDLTMTFYGDVSEELIKESFGDDVSKTIEQLKHLSKQKGVQARLPFELKIK